MRFPTLLTVSLFVAVVHAQTGVPRPKAGTPRQIVSLDPAALAKTAAPQGYVVHPDRTVTFTYQDAKASEVALTMEGVAQPIPLTKGEGGAWTLTTQPIEPEEYEYSYRVDGSRVIDPLNPRVRTSFFSVSSILRVPGSTPMPWELQSIPHGMVTHLQYQSRLLSDQRDLYIYTPPGYDSKRTKPYPVLYLLHGYSDDASAWVQKAEANYILDTLIAQGKLEPMVMVMPLAYGTMAMITDGWGVWTAPFTTPLRNQTLLTDQLINEVLPMTEASYNVARDPAHRAIAGLSMGGGESITTGLNHPEVFGYVGAFSSAIVSPMVNDRPAGTVIDAATYNKAFDGIVPNARTKPPVRLFWLSCGTEDGLITANRAFGSWAKTNIKGSVSIHETPGMHTWLVWRQNLIAFTPLLFK